MEEREDSSKMYKRISDVWNHGNKWYGNIVYKTLQELYNQGYVTPKAYILNYYENSSSYTSDIIILEDDALSDPNKNKVCHQYLKEMTVRMEDSLIAFMFVSEGTFTSESGEKSSFLLFTFENKTSGRRDVYRCTKQTLINDKGLPSVKIVECFHDTIASVKAKIPIIEKYNRILRPNYTERVPELYN